MTARGMPHTGTVSVQMSATVAGNSAHVTIDVSKAPVLGRALAGTARGRWWPAQDRS